MNSLLKKAGILLGTILTLAYISFRLTIINTSIAWLIPLAVLLFIAELHIIIHLLGSLHAFWPRKYPDYTKNKHHRDWQINALICVCGEPVEIVRQTILSAKKAADLYNETVKPEFPARVVVINDGRVARKSNWKAIERAAQHAGVMHIARTQPGGYKAGNINHALSQLPTADPHNTIDIIFDSDMAANPDCFLELVKPFTDQDIDFVQSPQRYQNGDTWVSQASGAHQIYFFDHICPVKAKDNALFLCGTNFAIRRSALQDVGGIDTKFITEDYATSVKLHNQGKRGVFIPQVLAVGMAPQNLKEYFNQQTRWAKGNFDTTKALFKEIFFGQMTAMQKWHYFLSATYYLIGIRDFILILAPIPFLFLGISLIDAQSSWYLPTIYLPYLIYNFLVYIHTFRHPFKSIILDLICFPIYARAFFQSLINQRLGFIVTIKKYNQENIWLVYRWQLIIMLLLWAGVTYSITHLNVFGQGIFINYFWATFNALGLTTGLFLVLKDNYHWTLPVRWSLQPMYRLVNVFTIIIISGILLVSQTFPIQSSLKSVPGEIHKQTTKLQLFLPESGSYYGYYFPQLQTYPQHPQTGLNTSERASLTMYYQDWTTEFNRDFMSQLYNTNTVPVITWEPWDISNPESQEFNPSQILAGAHDDYIRKWARSAREFERPFFLRFAHEMNGDWYPWSVSPKEYVAMWQHIHDQFQAEGADNVIWVWSPNHHDNRGQVDTITQFYPGDDYVDWVGVSIFNWGTTNKWNKWKSFEEIINPTYTVLSNYNKPIMVAELGTVTHGGDRHKWLIETLTVTIPKLDQIKAIILFSENHGEANFALDSDPDHLRTIEQSILNNPYYWKQPQWKLTNAQ